MVEAPPCGWSPTNDGWNPTTGGWSPTTGERTPLRDYNRPAGRENVAIGELQHSDSKTRGNEIEGTKKAEEAAGRSKKE